MKKIVTGILAATMVLSLAGCSKPAEETKAPETQAAAETEAPTETEAAETEAAETEAEVAAEEAAQTAEIALPEGTEERNPLNLFVDGVDVSDEKTAYADIIESFDDVVLDGVQYYAVSLTDLCAYDLSTVQGVFVEATDGFVKYVSDVDKLYLAAFQSEDGAEYTPVELDGAYTYGSIVEGGSMISGVTNVYMVTEPAQFEVSVQVNGEELGKLTMADFMKKTPVGEEKVTTAMFDGSFKYNMGDSTYNGRFLGINYETMLAKLDALGMTVEGEIKEVEYYGTPGMGKEGKNMEYTLYPDEKTYFANTEFFCMYDGMTRNAEIKDVPMGLTAFINGTGSKWVTYNLSAINFITE